MNTTTTTTSTATTNAAATPSTLRPSYSSMPDLRRAVPVMISRMLSTTPQRSGPGGHGRARDHSPQPSTSRASVGHGAGILSPTAKRGQIVCSLAPRLATTMPRAPSPRSPIMRPSMTSGSDLRTMLCAYDYCTTARWWSR